LALGIENVLKHIRRRQQLDDLATLIRRVRDGEVEAFSPVVKRFQDMAVGYAWSILGDFHLAEDAAQNAFLTAFLNLESVEEPAAFPGWIRRIVFTECTRLTRVKRPETVDVDETLLTDAKSRSPDAVVETKEKNELVNELVGDLPDRSREVVILYYLAGLSQAEIAVFLGTEEGTVKKRLHDARVRMQKGIEKMADENLKGRRPSRNPEFTESTVAIITTATEAINTGDAGRLRALLESRPDIVHVGGALDFRYGDGSYFAGADPNAMTEVGFSMLNLICWRVPREMGVLIDAIDLLVSRHADPNLDTSRSPLENALWHGETEAGNALLRHGANVDLRLAAGVGRIDLMEGFFESDGSLAKDAYALAPPVGEGYKRELQPNEILVDAITMAVLNWQFDAIEFLLEKGADINAFTHFAVIKDITPLHTACCVPGKHRIELGEPGMVAFLMDRGADPLINDESDPVATPFQWAIHNGHPKIVAYMLDRGGCVSDMFDHLCHTAGQSRRTKEGDLLDGAVWPEIARVLIAAGANPLASEGGRKSAIEVAEESGSKEMVKLLKETAGL
jgi:RNA polymerase sigma factor (sigma-70 family)